MQSFFNNNEDDERELTELTNTIFETLINDYERWSRYLSSTPDAMDSLRDTVYKLVKIASEQNKLLLQFPAVLAYFVYNFLKNIDLDRINDINEKLDNIRRMIQRKNLQGLSFSTIKQLLQHELQEKKFRHNRPNKGEKQQEQQKQQEEQKQSGNKQGKKKQSGKGEKQQQKGGKEGEKQQEGKEGQESESEGSQGQQGQELGEESQEGNEQENEKQGQQGGEEGNQEEVQQGGEEGEQQGGEEGNQEEGEEGGEEEGELGGQQNGEEGEEQGNENEGQQGQELGEEGQQSGEEGNEGEQGNAQEGQESEGESQGEQQGGEQGGEQQGGEGNQEEGEEGGEEEGELGGQQNGEEGEEQGNENEGQQGQESGEEGQQSGEEGNEGEQGNAQEGQESEGESENEGQSSEEQEGQNGEQGGEQGNENEENQSGEESGEGQNGEQGEESQEGNEQENEGQSGNEAGQGGEEGGEQEGEEEGEEQESGEGQESESEESQSGEGETQEGEGQEGEGGEQQSGEEGEQEGQESEGESQGEQQGGEEGNQGQNSEQGQESGGEGQQSENEDIIEDLENNIDEESRILDELQESLQKSLSALSIGKGSGGGVLKDINPRVLELLESANRLLALATQVDLQYANRGVKDQGGVMKGITTGNNVKHMFKSQLVLPDEIFLERYTNRALLQRAVENEGVGDLYFMIDKSGSMGSEMPNGYTAFENVSAVALASSMEAEKNNKKVFVQYFDNSTTEPIDVNNVFELAQTQPGGGTDMMVALRQFMEYYNNYPGLKDVKQIFILSDFETNYDTTLSHFKNFARNNGLVVTCIHVYNDEVPDEMQYIIDEICDEYYKFNDYDASELFSAVYSKI